jgi:hypothetical protein
MPPPGQKIEPLSTEDTERIAKQRGVIEQYLGGDAPNLQKYQTAAGKLGLLRALLDHKVFQQNQTYELQCMGIVLGDALVQHSGVEWRAVEDQYGRDPCVQIPGSTVVLFPLTMISKRVEKGETIDLFDLFNRMVAEIEELRYVADHESYTSR